LNDYTKLRLPNFIGIGPERTGTTWLHRVLIGHAGMPQRVKELHFFDRHYSKGHAWYAGHFSQYPPQFRVGEITPSYFASSAARLRIANDLPECKVICTLRDPVARLYSLYKLMCHLGKIDQPSFELALQKDRPLAGDHRYADRLGLWMEACGRENVLVCFYDDLAANPQAYLDQVADFIQFPRISIADSGVGKNRIHAIAGAPRRPRLARMMWRLHRSMDRERAYSFRRAMKSLGVWQFCFADGAPFPPLDPELDARLRLGFLSDIEALEEMLGNDLSSWRDPRSQFNDVTESFGMRYSR
jgi:hypothetical protein